MSRVQHIIKTGLNLATRYRIYVTQRTIVGSQIFESRKSSPVDVIVGDIYAPTSPIGTAQIENILDTTQGTLGKWVERGFIYFAIKWLDISSTTPDLYSYRVYIWPATATEFANFTSAKDYPASIAATATYQREVATTTTSHTFGPLTYGLTYFVGIQAIDISNNASPIWVARVLGTVPGSVPGTPNTPTVSQDAAWTLAVSINCPTDPNMKLINIYRDGLITKKFSMPYVSGATAIFKDILAVLDGPTHFYTCSFVDYADREGPKSSQSLQVTAKLIDTAAIDQTILRALVAAWTEEQISHGDISEINTLRNSLAAQVSATQSLAAQLQTATTDYNILANNYTILANNFEVLSASVENQGNNIVAMQTSITQNSSEIALKASKAEIDEATQQVINYSTSQYEQTAERIAQVVYNLNNNAATYASISTLAGSIELKASRDDLNTARDAILETTTAQITINTDSIAQIVSNLTHNASVYTSIKSLSDSIELKASRAELNSATGTLTTTATSLFEQNAEGITQIVSNLNNNVTAYAAISTMATQIALKVDSGNVINAINISNEGIAINGSRLSITADTYFDGNVNIRGNLKLTDCDVIGTDGTILMGRGRNRPVPIIETYELASLSSTSGSGTSALWQGQITVPGPTNKSVRINVMLAGLVAGGHTAEAFIRVNGVDGPRSTFTNPKVISSVDPESGAISYTYADKHQTNSLYWSSQSLGYGTYPVQILVARTNWFSVDGATATLIFV